MLQDCIRGYDVPVNSQSSNHVELDRDVCKLVHRLSHLLDAHVRRVADRLDLTTAQVVALRELTEPITARELAVRMGCEPSNVTFVLDRLERAKLVERRPHPVDRRAKQIVLTAAGRTRRDGVLEELALDRPTAPLSRDQHETLRGLLETLSS